MPTRFGRRKRQQFKVIGRGPVPDPPRRIPFVIGGMGLILTVWTNAEWAALTPSERPEKAGILIGLGGRFWLTAATQEEIDQAKRDYWDHVRRFGSLRVVE